MQSKVVAWSCASAAAAVSTPTISTAGVVARSWRMLSSWRASSSTTSTRRRSFAMRASSLSKASTSCSRFTGFSA
jgi:L,D-peptidoglycan transpeptidase YkuD (ErfK/YbiS/YcfS/YnhG family)